MAFFPPIGPTIKCKHPHPHNFLHRHDGDCVYDDGYTRVHCSNVTCEKEFCHKDHYIPHPHQHCNFDDHWDEHYCPYNRYKTYHGHMHIDPCHHDHVIQTTPVYNYDYDRNVYVPSYRGDNGLVLNLDYAVKSIIAIDITYENGEHLTGEILEGYKYDFIYADSGILKRDVGVLTSIEVTNGEVSDSRLGFANPTTVAAIYLHFDCSSDSKAHTVVVDINLLRAINIVEDKPEEEIAIILPNGEKLTDINEAINAVSSGDSLNGNGTFVVENTELSIPKDISLSGFIFKNTQVKYTNIEDEIYITHNVFEDGSSISVTGAGDVNLIANQFTATIPYGTDGSVRNAVILDVSGKAIVTDNEFNNTGAYYNAIEFGQTNALGTGSIVENNYFLNAKNNMISIFMVEPDAKIVIKNNLFENQSNPIRLSNYNNSKAKFRFINNKYNSTDQNLDYAGFMLLQAVKGEDFSNYDIYIEGLYYKDNHLTEQGENDLKVWYVYDTETIPNVYFLD